jgi:hypothetical protein
MERMLISMTPTYIDVGQIAPVADQRLSQVKSLFNQGMYGNVS